MNDLRYAVRQLFKSPGFTTIALITLALGIGLNTSMFSLTNFLLLQPLPFPDRDQLIRIYRTTPQSNNADHTTPDYVEIVRQSGDFAEVAGYRWWSLSLAHADRPPVNLNALRVSANLFSVLGVRPHLGRFFHPEEDQPASAVVVLSHETWLAQFGGDPNIVGRVVRLDGEPTTIIGVAPRIPGSLLLWGPGELFRPLALIPKEKTDHDEAKMAIVGRLRSNLPLEQANLRLANVAAELAQSRPSNQIQDGLRAATLQSTTSTAQSRGLNLLLLALAGFVLLIACANLANLQLARATARGREFAIRAALGASRSRLLRPLLFESLLLSLIGGLLGILVAAWTNDWLSSQLSANGFVAIIISLDWRVASFAFAVATFTGVLFGLMPAWSLSRTRANDALRSGTRGNTNDRAQHRLRHGLIIGQFALALVLLAGAGAIIGGFKHLLSRESGWNHHSVLHGIVNLPTAKYPSPEQAYAFYTRIQERVATLPQVEHVAISWTVPITRFTSSRNYVMEGRDPPVAGREPLAFVNSVTPSYFSTLQIPLLSGRNFTAADNLSAPRVVIISESMARTLFPGEDPIGQRIGAPDAANRNWAEIIGVMPDQRPSISIVPLVTQFSVFQPLAQDTWNYATITVRAPNAGLLAEPMRRMIAELDPDLPVEQLGTVQERIKLGTNVIHLTNTILVAFALLGLFLSAIGLYGVVARLVLQRTPELGVRVALGAQPNEVVWLILRSGLRLTLIGAGIGSLGSIGLVQLVASFLPDAPVRDPLPIIAVTLLLLSIALFACWLPARRASRIDPIVALRTE